MTHSVSTRFPTVSNTIIRIPDYALFPTEGTYYPLVSSNTQQDLVSELLDNGRTGLFTNPVASAIANTADVANSLYQLISQSNNHLSTADKNNLLGSLGSYGSTLSFSENPANTSILEITYTSALTGETVFETFTANGNVSSFVLSSPPINSAQPLVFVNSVYQNNGSFAISYSANNGLLGRLSALADHTNRISGLSEARVERDSDLEKIMALGISLNTLTNGIDYGIVGYRANGVLYCMGSLFCSDYLQTFRDVINNEISVSINANTTNVDYVTSRLSEINNQLTNFVESDLDYYNEVKEHVAFSTLAAFVQTANSEPSGIFVLKNLVGTETLKTILSLPRQNTD